MQGYIYVCSNDMDINSLQVIFSPPLFCSFCSITANYGAAAALLHCIEIKLYEVSSNKCFFTSELPTSDINTGMWFAGGGECEIVMVDI